MDYSRARSAYGDATRPTLLFLHGIRLGRAIWERHARALAPRYHVVTLDLPGHGALAGVPFDEERIVELLDDTIDWIGAPPLVVGYSLGGFVAMRYAASFPERTRALLLADCTLDFEDWKLWPFDAGVGFVSLLPRPVLDAFLHATLQMTLPREYVGIVERIPFDRDVLGRTNAMARSATRSSDGIATYRKPVLFVNGEFDLAFRSDERRFLHRLPQARLRIMHGLDHAAPMRRVDEFVAIVEQFAQKVFA
ncbi:MAG TPA: alpha/beta fold hydrolase [Verrucomicrobiae bacterium]|nr:alpha/beta fold hydrolase [Verrucomicrobiae bacterium]